MIGVLVSNSDESVAREFFELFKTPWDFYRAGAAYDVVLVCGAPEGLGLNPRFDTQLHTRLVVVYSAERLAGDPECEPKASGADGMGRLMETPAGALPLYGRSLSCFGAGCSGAEGGELVRLSIHAGELAGDVAGAVRARVGYDLFGEVRHLLETGQPARFAGYPTLELHIDLLRRLILCSGAGLVEIPPTPAGYSFTACLTHDMDHPSLRAHGLDRTAIGFFYRALAGSVGKLWSGRLTLRGLVENWLAALSLPLVLLGWMADPWRRFVCYREIEGEAGSTFFVIPRKRAPGKLKSCSAPSIRGAGYALGEIEEQLSQLIASGSEVGLHGIDAWCDEELGRQELSLVAGVAGAGELGVRMHWLYFDQDSFTHLERAGAVYDSTVGYNETVGFRAGLAQVYKPLGATRLLELPLHLMDTALFYPSHLHLRFEDAWSLMSQLLDRTAACGGVFTVNWHDRSLAPERQWGCFYSRLLAELRRRGAWLVTAGEAVRWFRSRRLATFDEVVWEGRMARIGVRAKPAEEMAGVGLPGLMAHVYAPSAPDADLALAGTRVPERVEIKLAAEPVAPTVLFAESPS